MNKICTTIEQSKKLIELGIDINTADMRYSPLNLDIPWVWVSKPLIEKDAIPAWSLSALLELMPKILLATPNPVCDKYHCYGFHQEFTETFGDTVIDAAFKMVVWLKENKYI